MFRGGTHLVQRYYRLYNRSTRNDRSVKDMDHKSYAPLIPFFFAKELKLVDFEKYYQKVEELESCTCTVAWFG